MLCGNNQSIQMKMQKFSKDNKGLDGVFKIDGKLVIIYKNGLDMALNLNHQEKLANSLMKSLELSGIYASLELTLRKN